MKNSVLQVDPLALLFTSAAYIQVHLRLDFSMEANNINPDQTRFAIKAT